MKRRLLLPAGLIIAFLITCYFIPYKKEKDLLVKNTFQNIIATVSNAKNWAKWNGAVTQAWQKDSSACTITNDSAHNIFTINMPGKKIKVTQLTALLYEVEEIQNGQLDVFGFSVIPYTATNPQQAEHNSRIAYAWNSNLLYYLLPFLEPATLADNTITHLATYLNNNQLFYGFEMCITQTSDTIFITQNESFKKEELFAKLPVLFNNLQNFAQAKMVKSNGNKNVAYTFLNNDSLYIVAGLNVDKVVPGEFVTNVMQLPYGQVLATGSFEGIFKNRLALYSAMRRFIADQELTLSGAPFEKYLSPLPRSEDDSVKIQLCYPLHQN